MRLTTLALLGLSLVAAPPAGARTFQVGGFELAFVPVALVLGGQRLRRRRRQIH